MQQMQKLNGKRCDNESAQREKSEDFHRKLWQFFKSIAAIAVSWCKTNAFTVSVVRWSCLLWWKTICKLKECVTTLKLLQRPRSEAGLRLRIQSIKKFKKIGWRIIMDTKTKRMIRRRAEERRNNIGGPGSFGNCFVARRTSIVAYLQQITASEDELGFQRSFLGLHFEKLESWNIRQQISSSN